MATARRDEDGCKVVLFGRVEATNATWGRTEIVVRIGRPISRDNPRCGFLTKNSTLTSITGFPHRGSLGRSDVNHLLGGL